MKLISLKKISVLFIATLLVVGVGAGFLYSYKAHADDVTLTVTTLADDVDDATCT